MLKGKPMFGTNRKKLQLKKSPSISLSGIDKPSPKPCPVKTQCLKIESQLQDQMYSQQTSRNQVSNSQYDSYANIHGIKTFDCIDKAINCRNYYLNLGCLVAIEKCIITDTFKVMVK